MTMHPSRRIKPFLGIALGLGLMLLSPALGIWKYVTEMHHLPPHGAPAAEYSAKISAHVVDLLLIGAAGVIGFLVGLALFMISVILFIRSGAAASATPAAARLTATMVTAIGAAFGVIILGVIVLAWASIAPMAGNKLTSTVLVDDTNLPTVTILQQRDGTLLVDNSPMPWASLEAFLKSKSTKRVIVHPASGVGYDQREVLYHELERYGIEKIYFQEEAK